MSAAPELLAGFADAARESQRTFRAVLDALAHPGRSYPIAGVATAPASIGPALAAVALTLLDEDTTARLEGPLAEAADWLVFHSGTRLGTDADFVLSTPADLPPLAALAQGTDEDPHRSATVLLDLRGISGAATRSATGPGIERTATIDASWFPRGFDEAWAANTASFPRGVDLVLVAETSVSALPRTTRLGPAS